MTNPQIGSVEIAAAQEQPEVLVNGVDRAITQALCGQITIDITVDANLTLQATAPPDAGDQWAAGTIVITDTGVVLTGGIDVIYPDVDTLYGGPSRLMFVFVNNTAQILTVRRAGQPGIAIAAGVSALLYHDGTDIVAIVASI
ncbi:MAG TPA: hypothetical protein PKH39_17775 [Woeseiaceae bacterium]|nr:hypothetical protein [Woeseiaceae bacterium]